MSTSLGFFGHIFDGDQMYRGEEAKVSIRGSHPLARTSAFAFSSCRGNREKTLFVVVAIVLFVLSFGSVAAYEAKDDGMPKPPCYVVACWGIPIGQCEGIDQLPPWHIEGAFQVWAGTDGREETGYYQVYKTWDIIAISFDAKDNIVLTETDLDVHQAVQEAKAYCEQN
jgi:hypothetical protein